MALLVEVKQFCDTHQLLRMGDCVVIGVSGGPDSVCLLHVLSALQPQLKLTLVVAHFNHQWRAEADDDAQFVAALAASFGVQCKIGVASAYEDLVKYKGSAEAHARMMRRLFFESVVAEVDAQKIALGHTADDQKETFFIRLIRGSSIAGLAGIRPKRGDYIRPLLSTSRAAVEAYIQEYALPFRHDVTNESERFLRNRIRQSVLPALRAADPRSDKNLLKVMDNLWQTDKFIMRMVDACVQSMVTEESGTVWLNYGCFITVDSYLKIPLIMAICTMAHIAFVPTTAFFNEILRFFDNKKSSYHLLGKAGTLLKKRVNGTRYVGFVAQ